MLFTAFTNTLKMKGKVEAHWFMFLVTTAKQKNKRPMRSNPTNPLFSILSLKLQTGVEPVTSALPMRRSTN